MREESQQFLCGRSWRRGFSYDFVAKHSTFVGSLFFLRAIPCKPQTKVLNRCSQIWLAFTYVIEARVLWILVKAVSKNIEPFSFYRVFTETPGKCTFLRGDFWPQIRSPRYHSFGFVFCSISILSRVLHIA